jgi:hypothetical protein
MLEHHPTDHCVVRVRSERKCLDVPDESLVDRGILLESVTRRVETYDSRRARQFEPEVPAASGVEYHVESAFREQIVEKLL